MTSNETGRPIPPDGAHGAPSANHESAAPATKEDGKRPEKTGRLASFGYGVLGGLLSVALVLCLGSFTPLLNAFKGGVVTSSNGNITITPSDEPTLAEAVAAKTLGSAVTIYVYSDNSSWNQYFGSGGSSSNSPTSLGSGVIISVEGDNCYIVTNAHVVQGASRLQVTAGDAQYEGQIVGSDSKTDLAVVKIKASGMTPMEWGDSSTLQVGEWVMAIGSPFGYEQTVTTGIVSAMYRSDVLQGSTGTGTTVYTDMIQTDAAINPGNSGGALVDDEGKLIGINTYISSSSQSSAGLGFAIPVNTVKRIAEQMISGQTVSHAFLGITMASSTNPAGVAVTSVYKDTAAAKAGLQTGDVIVKINGSAVTSPNEVSIAVGSKNAGDSIEITYVRGGREVTTTATLGSDDVQTSEYAENGAPASSGSGNGSTGSSRSNPFGF